MVSLVACPAIAQTHGTFQTTYSGGSGSITASVQSSSGGPATCSNTPQITPFALSSGQYAGSASVSADTDSGGGTNQCSARILKAILKASFAWTPDPSNPSEPAPTVAILTQTCSASWSFGKDSTSTGKGTGPSNGLSNGVTTPPGSDLNNQSATSSSTLYSAWSGSSASCSSSAGFTGTSGPGYNHAGLSGSVGAAYSASVTPVFINISGTTKDSSGNDNILVGQQCKATVVGIPTGNGWQATYSWSVSGTTFENWSPTSPTNANASYLNGGPIPATNSTQWCWNDPNPAMETVKCMVTVTPPAGQGSPFSLTVTAPQQISVQLPTWTAFGTGGYMQVNTYDPAYPASDFSFYAGPTNAMDQNSQSGGMNFKATSTTSPMFGQGGGVEMVQLVTPSLSYTTNANPPVVHTDPEQSQGLDTHYPKSSNGASGEGTTPYLAGDVPGIDLTAHNAGAASGKHQFVDYLLYKPPGANSQWITLAQFNWSVNGSATLPGTGSWADYVKQNGSDSAGIVTLGTAPSGTATSTPFTSVYGPDFFVSWTRINVFPSF